MRRLIGIFLKGFAFVILAVSIVFGVLTVSQPGAALVPQALQVYACLGFFAFGFFVFCLLYAYGQAIQGIIQIEDDQTSIRHMIREITALLREQPAPPHQSPTSSLLDIVYPPAAPTVVDWRRPTPAGQPRQVPAPVATAPQYVSAPPPEPAPQITFIPPTAPPAQVITPAPQPIILTPPPALVQVAPPPEPVPQIACSRCGFVQDAGGASCVNCNATFIQQADI